MDWKAYSKIYGDILASLKKRDDKFTLLGCLPCYGKAYEDKEVNKEFCEFYEGLVEVFESSVDMYITELNVTAEHVNTILDIITRNSDKDIFLGIYPCGKITADEMKMIIEKKPD